MTYVGVQEKVYRTPSDPLNLDLLPKLRQDAFHRIAGDGNGATGILCFILL
jgi:hypothetical protein